MKKIKIAIVDDQPYLLSSLKETLAMMEESELVFSASNGQEAIHELNRGKKPELILMDINMPIMNGIEATGIITQQFPEIKVLMLTVFEDEHNIFDSIMAGACGYLLKDEKPNVLHNAIYEAMEGGAPMSTNIALKALQIIRNGPPQSAQDSANYDLSKREIEILEKIAVGKNYQEIADMLFISPKTVRKHIENIYQKLRVHNKVEAINLARKNKLIQIFV